MKAQRAVITGMGAVTPLGSSIDLFWTGLINGVSGVRKITQFDASEFPCQIAGEIPDFNPDLYLDQKETRRLPRSAQIALASAIQAVSDAGLPGTMPDKERAAVIYGTALGGIDQIDEGIITLRTQGISRVSPFTIPFGIPNLASFLIARQFQCLGPNSTIVTACATGTQTIGEAAELIRHGKADIVISGGTEALIKDYSVAGFCAMRALPLNYNENPQAASRPFDANREGFILSEGAGAIVVESLEHALNRGARIYAEIRGQSSTSDAFHIAQPDPDAEGAIRTMRWALDDAGIPPSEIDYINAHGTSTPLNDSTETKAIKAVFGEHAYKLAVSSTKSMIGHAMGASGTLEAIACVMSVVNDLIHPTINYSTPDPECDLDYVPNQARKRRVGYALSNSFGLGGQNACLIIKKYDDVPKQ
ncbi:MAG: beta-ketoacyl-[acyl-carrier-protein] synthase II [Chloroflexi bacterium RBG_16_47_49]|nr:MAG: beta-ketoacyl-[acyl-carrier-protein] synthase II [Chloroflexi bacterium RBG_16_47_49]